MIIKNSGRTKCNARSDRTLLPGANEGKPDPYETLKQSVQIGEQKGVRLSHALYAVAAQASGDDAKIRDALKLMLHLSR